MAIEGVIFDLGHTLMYLDSTWPEVFAQGVRDLATFLDDEGLDLVGQAFGQALLERRSEGFAQAQETLREVTAEASMRWTFARFGLPDPPPALVNSAIDAFFAYEDVHWLAYPEADQVLEELSARGLRLGMLSNATHDPFIQRLVDRLGFRARLDPALSSAGTGIRKPDPSAFGPILAAWDLAPASVVMVGDTLEADILGARRAGMRSVWIRSQGAARQESAGNASTGTGSLVEPDLSISRLAELPAGLRKLDP
jgi:HAD superfamily hydrolase (TIGR01549 family)